MHFLALQNGKIPSVGGARHTRVDVCMAFFMGEACFEEHVSWVEQA
jgi:hypothetical protein